MTTHKRLCVCVCLHDEAHSSIVGGGAGDDKHEVEGDDEFDHKGLSIGAGGLSSRELVVLSGE